MGDTVDLLVTAVVLKGTRIECSGYWIRQKDGKPVSEFVDTVRVNYPEDWRRVSAS